MKKIIKATILVLFLLAINNLFSNELGLLVGYNATTVHGSMINEINPQYNHGILFGIYQSSKISDKTELTISLTYNQKKSIYDNYNYNDYFMSISVEDVYANGKTILLPITIKSALNQNNTIYILGGIYGEYLYDISVGAKIFGYKFKTDINDIINKFNLGIDAGVGFKIKENIFIEIIYSIGITDIQKEGYLEYADYGMQLEDSPVKINNLRVQLGLKL